MSLGAVPPLPIWIFLENQKAKSSRQSNQKKENKYNGNEDHHYQYGCSDISSKRLKVQDDPPSMTDSEEFNFTPACAGQVCVLGNKI